MSNPDQPVQESTLSLAAKIEALLFVAPEAVTTAQLARALEVPQKQVEASLKELAANYADRGIRLQSHKGGYRLVSAPEAAALIEHFLGVEAATPLTRAALEVLAIIAYQQPVTRPQVDAIRGVNSDSVMKSLLNKGLIEEVGRAEGPGRPILYSTTVEFLSHFGLQSVKELPPLDLDALIAQNANPQAEILKE